MTRYSTCMFGLDTLDLDTVALDMGQANMLLSRCPAATRVTECVECDVRILHRVLNHLTKTMKPMTHPYILCSHLPVFPCLSLNAYMEERFIDRGGLTWCRFSHPLEL